jgi:hypothetical protein
MHNSATHTFEPGKAYLVSHLLRTDSDKPRATRKVRRIFKGMEKRFGGIPCAVFTCQVDPSTSATYDKASSTLTFRGPRVPQSEVSIPHYDLASAEPA